MVRLRRLRACFNWSWPLVFALLVMMLGIALFISLARDVLQQEAFGFDQTILTAWFEVASVGLTRFMLFVSDSAAPIFFVPFLLLLAIWWIWLRKRPMDWLALTVSLVGASLLNQFVKGLFERARPTLFEHLQEVGGYSFPSGHSQAAMAFYPVLAYLIARRVDPRWRLPIYVAAGLWVLLVGMSRNYLEVHYPSDVLAAFAVTLPWTLAVIFVHRCYAPPLSPEPSLIERGPDAQERGGLEREGAKGREGAKREDAKG